MPKLFKILLPLISVIILLILATEGYYVFLSPKNEDVSSQIPNLTEEMKSYSVQDWERQSAMISAIRLTTYEGIITIEKQSGVFENNPFDWVLKLKGKGKFYNTFYVANSYLGKIKILQKNIQGKETPASFYDLKTGDAVVVTSNINMIDNNASPTGYQSLSITKVEK